MPELAREISHALALQPRPDRLDDLLFEKMDFIDLTKCQFIGPGQ